jgi:hypothetical protein
LMDAVVRNITIASINKKERRKEKTTSWSCEHRSHRSLLFQSSRDLCCTYLKLCLPTLQMCSGNRTFHTSCQYYNSESKWSEGAESWQWHASEGSYVRTYSSIIMMTRELRCIVCGYCWVLMRGPYISWIMASK